MGNDAVAPRAATDFIKLLRFMCIVLSFNGHMEFVINLFIPRLVYLGILGLCSFHVFIFLLFNGQIYLHSPVSVFGTHYHKSLG